MPLNCITMESLKHQGRFADARVSADQNQRPFNQAAPQHPVKFPDAAWQPLFGVAYDLIDGNGF